ncbi:MAG: helix-turn-helix transcriptional regulator [Alphaproteobacteria bacterium]|nr:helix-turn-helix transcriptional regulator [Alphaproteobacteria bacterium]
MGNVSAGGEADSWSADALAAFRLAATYFHGRFCELAGLEEPLAVPRLSPREKECLSWLAAGKSAWDISVILGIGEHTVRDYVRSAMRKLGCVTQTQAVCEALRRGEIVL